MQGPFNTHFRVSALLIFDEPTVTMKCRTAIKVLFLYLNLCPSVMLNSLSCLFTSISFLINSFDTDYWTAVFISTSKGRHREI